MCTTQTARLRRITRRQSCNHDSPESSDDDTSFVKQTLSLRKGSKQPYRFSLPFPEEYATARSQGL